MGIEWLRDLIICISGCIAILVLIFIALVVYMLFKRTNTLFESMNAFYKRSNSVFDSLQNTATTVCGVVSEVRSEVVNPMVQVMSIVHGIQFGVDLVNKLFGKKQEGGNHDG